MSIKKAIAQHGGVALRLNRPINNEHNGAEGRLPTPAGPGHAQTMHAIRGVVGLAGVDPEPLAQYERDLAAFGFEVRPPHDLEQLAAIAAEIDVDAIGLIGPLLTLRRVIAELRVACPDVRIVAVSDFPDRQCRIETLLCGADACVAQTPDALELGAVLLALQRRMISTAIATPPDDEGPALDRSSMPPPVEPTRAEVGSKWRLANQGWRLLSPDGNQLALTSGERQLLMMWLAAKDGVISKASLLTPGEVGNLHDGAVSRKAVQLAVTISRLRRKAAAQGMRLPIHSVRGIGYCFDVDS
jgi:DNA-binding response OmpR family regulator